MGCGFGVSDSLCMLYRESIAEGKQGGSPRIITILNILCGTLPILQPETYKRLPTLT